MFKQKLKSDHNIEYAYAMFCSGQAYRELNLEFNYTELRNQVSKKCFEGWPRFNMDTLLSYSRYASSYQGNTGFADAGSSGSDAGCGGGGD